MKRRGFTLVDLLVAIALVTAGIGAVDGFLGRERWGWLFFPLAIVLAFALLCLMKSTWDSQVTLPRVLRRLDHLNEIEGKIDREIGRLNRLWISVPRLEEALLPRLDLDGPCRRAYLEILGRYARRRAIGERLRALAQEPDPLAPRAREILARHGLEEGPI